MLRLCMSGAGVAFPVQLISSPRHSVSILCYSSALHCTSSPRLCPASPLLCSPCPCLSVPIRRVAVPGQAWRFPCKSWHIHALAAQGFAFPARCGYKHCRSHAAYCISHASRIQTSPQPCVALPFRCWASRSYSGAFHCFALPRFALTKRTAPMHCAALLLRSASSPSRAHTLRSKSVPLRIQAPPFRRLSVRTIACAVQSLVKNCPTQPSALRGRPFAQGAGWLIMVRMRWRSASGFSVPCSTTTSS